MENISGITITEHQDSKRIIDIRIEDEILDKLIFPFNKFDITALEYKPFTRFTIAKSLDDLTSSRLSKLLNSIIRDRYDGWCYEDYSNYSFSSIGFIVRANILFFIS